VLTESQLPKTHVHLRRPVPPVRSTATQDLDQIGEPGATAQSGGYGQHHICHGGRGPALVADEVMSCLMRIVDVKSTEERAADQGRGSYVRSGIGVDGESQRLDPWSFGLTIGIICLIHLQRVYRHCFCSWAASSEKSGAWRRLSEIKMPMIDLGNGHHSGHVKRVLRVAALMPFAPIRQ
jgi:hypothetical protein